MFCVKIKMRHIAIFESYVNNNHNLVVKVTLANGSNLMKIFAVPFHKSDTLQIIIIRILLLVLRLIA